MRPYEQGLEDTVSVGENETVELLIRFDPPTVVDPAAPALGRYVMHCHNLIHEDHDVMDQSEVRSAGLGGLLDRLLGGGDGEDTAVAAVRR